MGGLLSFSTRKPCWKHTGAIGPGVKGCFHWYWVSPTGSWVACFLCFPRIGPPDKGWTLIKVHPFEGGKLWGLHKQSLWALVEEWLNNGGLITHGTHHSWCVSEQPSVLSFLVFSVSWGKQRFTGCSSGWTMMFWSILEAHQQWCFKGVSAFLFKQG